VNTPYRRETSLGNAARGVPSLSHWICHTEIRYDRKMRELNGVMSAKQDLIRQLL